jgi:hypothetical protein
MAHRASSLPLLARVVTETRRRKIPCAGTSNAVCSAVDRVPAQLVRRFRHLPASAEWFDQSRLQQSQALNTIQNCLPIRRDRLVKRHDL